MSFFDSRMRLLLTLLIFGAACSGTALGASKPNSANSIEKFQYKSALSASQNAIGKTLSNHSLTNVKGQTFSFSEFHGKPLVLSLIYTSCYAICPITIKHLTKVIEKAQDTLGTDSFSVAVLGFDARVDNPQAMKQFAKKQGLDGTQWHILSADQDTVNALADELGFLFFTSPNGFDHIVQASIIDADGQVYRQVYGETFDTPLLVSPLMDLVLGRPAPKQSLLDDLINKVRLFCTAYDPASDAYSFDYSLFIGRCQAEAQWSV